MELNCKLIYKLPVEAIRLMGINENTSFETYFEDGAIVVRPLSEEEIKKMTECENDCDCENCPFEDTCPYDEDNDDEECSPGCEDCEFCEYYCRRCGACTLDEMGD